MEKEGFTSEYYGFLNNQNTLIGASLIITRPLILGYKYAYAPRGFLVDYYNEDMLKKFTKKVKDFFFRKGFAFIKINPEITYSKLDFDNQNKLINSKNKQLIDKLKELGYDKLKDNLYFESLLPKYTPVIYLPTYNMRSLDIELVNSVDECTKSGLSIRKAKDNELEIFYNYVEDKDSKTLNYYKLFYDIFSKDDMADIMFVELDYNTYTKYLQKQYISETEINEKINQEFNENPNNNTLYVRKMESDKILSKISYEIAQYNDRAKDNKLKEILGAAFIIKHEGRITLLIQGHNKDFDNFDIKTFMYYKIIEEYKKEGFLFFDLNGITADYSESNPYKELNKFKLKFKPNVYEYIGEFDLIVNKPFHQILWSTNKIQKEFYKPAIKK